MNSNGGSSFFGSDWLGAFLIIAILFGGGFGFGGNRAPMPDVATKEYVMDSVNNQGIQSQLQQILLSSANNNYELSQRLNDQTMALTNFGYQLQNQIAQLGFKMDQCCCEIKTEMLQNKYDNLENQYRTAQNEISNAQQSQYILGALGRFVTNPPVASTAAAGT